MSDTNKSTGVSFSGLLLLTFIILKLAHVIDWKWVWVLSPLWLGLGVAIVILTAFFIFFND